jgi:hypothetical protein
MVLKKIFLSLGVLVILFSCNSRHHNNFYKQKYTKLKKLEGIDEQEIFDYTSASLLSLEEKQSTFNRVSPQSSAKETLGLCDKDSSPIEPIITSIAENGKTKSIKEISVIQNIVTKEVAPNTVQEKKEIPQASKNETGWLIFSIIAQILLAILAMMIAFMAWAPGWIIILLSLNSILLTILMIRLIKRLGSRDSKSTVRKFSQFLLVLLLLASIAIPIGLLIDGAGW